VDLMEDYLRATELCDFDRDKAIVEVTRRLTEACSGQRERFDRVYQYVKELPYGLEDWDVSASETLKKGWGMCCGKTNLLIAMSRVLLIPARYRVFRIRAERKLLARAVEEDSGLAAQLGDLPAEQDHLQCDANLDGWETYDPSRDTAFEDGLRRLDIPLEREPVSDVDGAVHYTILVSIDEWAGERQRSRRFREQREAVFARVNEPIARIRQIGSQP
jgi:hypothetical protein